MINAIGDTDEILPECIVYGWVYYSGTSVPEPNNHVVLTNTIGQVDDIYTNPYGYYELGEGGYTSSGDYTVQATGWNPVDFYYDGFGAVLVDFHNPGVNPGGNAY